MRNGQTANKVDRWMGKFQVDGMGRAVIPEGTTEIPAWAFDGNERLRFVQLPASVRMIGKRAFGNCTALESVELNEGLETIEGNAFTGCRKIRKLVCPDSLRSVASFTFYGLHLTEPVYNRSGSTLYHWPVDAQETICRLPKGVKRLAVGAFHECAVLEEIILPEEMEELGPMRFLEMRIRRIVIPESVRIIRKQAFWNCSELEAVVLMSAVTEIQYGAFYRCPKVRLTLPTGTMTYWQELDAQGIDHLVVPKTLRLPAGEFWREEAFVAHAERCATGDAQAMMAFAAYLEGQGGDAWYACAANFWRNRAAHYGSVEAQDWLDAWVEAHPHERLPAPMGSGVGGDPEGGSCQYEISGERFRALGFLFFRPERFYSIDERDVNGLYLVSSWCGEDGPDEDGYGREEYYDWWYLDEHLQEIPGVWPLHSYSSRDRRVLQNRFQEQYDKALAELNRRKLLQGND